ncbi:MAG: AbrB/MazE/SpoVT family DNA-binding domain-containing protein [Dehalococcoidia bacterium]
MTTSRVIGFPRPKDIQDTAKLSAKGWIVIPKALRKKMGIEPGDEVDIIVTKGDRERQSFQILADENRWPPEMDPLVVFRQRVRVSPKGWIVIPASIRQEYGFEAGEELEVGWGFYTLFVDRPIKDWKEYERKFIRTGTWTLEDIQRWKNEERELEDRLDEQTWRLLSSGEDKVFDYQASERKEPLTIRDASDD